MTCFILRFALPLLIVGVGTSAMAQDPVMADAYFRAGIKAMEESNFDLACPDLERSQKMDPKAGTLFALADCERQRGRFVISLNYFDEYLRQVEVMSLDKRDKHAVRVNLAKAHKAAMVKEVAQVVIVLPPDVPSDAKVYRDGVELPNEMLDKIQYVEAGNHLIRLEVEGMAAIEQTIFFEMGKVRRLEFDMAAIAPIRSDEPQPPLLELKKKPEQTPRVVVLPPKSEKRPTNTMRTGGFVALGVGAGGLIVGGITGGLAIKAAPAVDELCPRNACRKQGDLDHWRQSLTVANVSTAGFALGAAATGAGLVMLILNRERSEKPRAQAVKVSVLEAGPAGTMVGVQGVFQ